MVWRSKAGNIGHIPLPLGAFTRMLCREESLKSSRIIKFFLLHLQIISSEIKWKENQIKILEIKMFKIILAYIIKLFLKESLYVLK